MRLKTLMHKLEEEYQESFESQERKGLYTFTVNDKHVIFLEEVDHDNFFIFTSLGEITDDVGQRTLYEFLSANYFLVGTEGAVLSIDQSTHSLVLLQKVNIFHITYDRFLELLTHFVNVAFYWEGKVHSSQTNTTTNPSDSRLKIHGMGYLKI